MFMSAHGRVASSEHEKEAECGGHRVTDADLRAVGELGSRRRVDNRRSWSVVGNVSRSPPVPKYRDGLSLRSV